MKRYGYDDEEQVVKYPAPVTIKETKIRSRIEARLQYTGKVSGRLYEWSRAGSVISVQDDDVPELLSKRLGKKSCCGNSENQIFELA